MGYISRNIAVLDEPKQISLAGLPNFFQIQSTPGVKIYYEINLTVVAPAMAKSRITITEPGGTVHTFTGTTVAGDVGGNVFYIAALASDTAENIRQALLKDSYVSANFQVTIPFTYVGPSTITDNGAKINIKSKGAGTAFNITTATPDDAVTKMYNLEVVSAASASNDSISGEAGTVVVALDVYVDSGISLGVDDKPTTVAALGTFAITLSKTYAGAPLWFDLNEIFTQYAQYALPVAGWFATKTMRQYRFVARIEGTNNYSFYQSSALYILNGYGYASDAIDLRDYTYVDVPIKLLTNKPRTPYVKGQIEYLNFIFSDWTRALNNAPDFTIAIQYNAYTAADQFIGSITDNIQHRGVFDTVNTCQLSIDNLLTAYPNTGIVRVVLVRGNAPISNALEYTIRPACLHDLKQFSFLNRLGGWDSFNFDVKPQTDIKASFDTFNKTVKPGHTKSDGIQTVYASGLDKTITLVGAPVTNDVAEWLSELAAARVVLDAQGRYIIKTEFTMTMQDSTRNMQIPTMKYTYSETYTND